MRRLAVFVFFVVLAASARAQIRYSNGARNRDRSERRRPFHTLRWRCHNTATGALAHGQPPMTGESSGSLTFPSAPMS